MTAMIGLKQTLAQVAGRREGLTDAQLARCCSKVFRRPV
jgi:hypothetical protein